MANEVRLIDANALSRRVFDASYWDNQDEDVIWNLVQDAPTLDAVEVVHGNWQWFVDRCEDLFLGCDDDYGWRCSLCKTPLEDCDSPEVPPTYNYCPHCGAKMDGERKTE